jgi:hypothetical protein
MVVNLIVGVTLVLLAWARGARPGVGTSPSRSSSD